MADRRMFAMTIMDSDAFLDLPLSSQALYVHLCMRADDDGFLNNAKKIQRMVGADEADLQELLERRFLISFPSGVVVIKHWRMHNYIKKDRYKETVYTEEKGQLDVKENGSYTEGEQFGYSSDTLWNQFGYSLEPQVRVRDRVRVRVSKENLCPELEQSPSVEADDCTKEPSNATSEIPKKEQKHYVTFMQFWSAYPRKVGKGAAEKSWKNLKVDDTLLKTILDAVEAQKKSNQWVRDNGQYIPNPTTWLNQKRWEDEIDSTGAVGAKAYGRQKAIGRVSTESGSTISIDDYNTI